MYRLRRLSLRLLHVAPSAPELSEARWLIDNHETIDVSHAPIFDAAARQVAAHNLLLLRHLRADEALVRSLHSEMRKLAALCYERGMHTRIAWPILCRRTTCHHC